MKYVALTICLFLTTQAAVSADCNGSPCGAGPFKLFTPQGHKGADFRPACSQHDACYGSGCASRKACDQALLHNMLSTCHNSRNPAACERRARLMHLNVRLFGGKFFQR